MEIQSIASDEEKVQLLGEELKRLSQENKELHHLLEAMSIKYNNLQAFVLKIKQEMDSSSSQELIIMGAQQIDPLKPNTRRILVRTNKANPSLIVKDGYQWKKYGQKVTKDNPSPRAYFRCALAPRCHVKKKVQRCADDNSVIMATYEGEHDHQIPRPGEFNGLPSSLISTSTNCPLALDLSLSRNINIDPKNEAESSSNNNNINQVESSSSHSSSSNLMQECIRLLARDPNTREALAGAVANYIHQHHKSNK